MASISIPIPKPLSPLDLLRRRSKPPPPPPSIASFSSTFSSPPFLRLRHPHPPIHGLLPRFRASVVAQDSSGQLDDEDLDEVGARGGNDWGQQEESSDEEAAGGDEGGFPLPPEDAKLFVGNLPFDVDSSRLANLFQEAGVVEVSEVIYNSETNWSRGFGFVTMSTVEEAVKATEMFNGHDLNGRRLRVNKATRKGSPPPRSHRIFVANIPFHVDGPQLEEVFSNYGTVIEARVVYEKDTGRSRGFAFVRMSNDQETDDAISSLDGKELDGRDMRVSIAEERSRSSP